MRRFRAAQTFQRLLPPGTVYHYYDLRARAVKSGKSIKSNFLSPVIHIIIILAKKRKREREKNMHMFYLDLPPEHVCKAIFFRNNVFLNPRELTKAKENTSESMNTLASAALNPRELQ